MPLNVGLSAGARIELLDSLLRHEKWWTKEELRRELCNYTRAMRNKDISDATLRNDLEEIRIKAGSHFLEEKKGRKKVFRYDDRSFSVYNIEMPDLPDYEYMQQAVKLLEQVKGFALSEALKALLVKLKYVVPVSPGRPIIQFDGPERFAGMELLQQVYDAISCEQVIAFDYQPFTEKAPHTLIIHPYLLKEYNNRWFLVGLNDANRRIWVTALDRFKSNPRPRVRIGFIQPEAAGFDATQFFSEVVGVTVMEEQKSAEVQLKFSPARAPYILSKPLHNSQVLLKTYRNGAVLLGYYLRFNKELLSVLLSFGDDVEVKQPAILRKMMHENALRIAMYYAPDAG